MIPGTEPDPDSRPQDSWKLWQWKSLLFTDSEDIIATSVLRIIYHHVIAAGYIQPGVVIVASVVADASEWLVKYLPLPGKAYDQCTIAWRQAERQIRRTVKAGLPLHP